VTDVDTVLVVAQLYELIDAPAHALRCYTAALALQPSHIDIWLRLVGTATVFLNIGYVQKCNLNTLSGLLVSYFG